MGGIQVTHYEGQGMDFCKSRYKNLGFVKGENC